MLISKFVEVKINKNNINNLKEFYPDIKLGDNIKISVNHLTKGSHVLVDVKCDFCDKLRKTEYELPLRL